MVAHDCCWFTMFSVERNVSSIIRGIGAARAAGGRAVGAEARWSATTVLLRGHSDPCELAYTVNSFTLWHLVGCVEEFRKISARCLTGPPCLQFVFCFLTGIPCVSIAVLCKTLVA